MKIVNHIILWNNKIVRDLTKIKKPYNKLKSLKVNKVNIWHKINAHKPNLIKGKRLMRDYNW